MWPTLLLFSGGFLFWVGLWSHRRAWQLGGGGLLGLVFAGAVGRGSIELVILPVLAGMIALAWALKTKRCRVGQTAGGLIYVLGVLALGFHQVPGLTPLPLWETQNGVFPFPPEKIILLWMVPPLVRAPLDPTGWRWGMERPGRFFALMLAVTLLILIPVALGLGHMRPGWTDAPIRDLAYGLAYHFLFVCVLEESFFRGMVQTVLMGWMRGRGWPYADALGLFSASLLFGAAHLGGGLAFALLATLAGIGYGAVYHGTGRIQYAVLLHFAVNAVHQLAFARLPVAV
jgi:membrane protease YdiL (CAAX protease family)